LRLVLPRFTTAAGDFSNWINLRQAPSRARVSAGAFDVSTPPARPASSSGALWAAAGSLLLLTIAWHWPGKLIGDSITQLSEIESGRLTDWHPPLMAVIWRALGSTPQSMLVLQASLYWLGLALLADRLRLQAGTRWAYAMLLIGLTPMSFIYLGVIQKDTLMTALFILAVGMSVRSVPAYGLVPAFVGMLVRANAVFAMPPLVVRSRRIAPTIALCLVLALLLVPVSRFINLSLLGAERSNVEKTLQLFDLAGIQKISGRRDLGPDIASCYSPFYWDSLEYGCQAFARSRDDLAGTWLGAIVSEPVAYARHRVSHFNHAIFFAVPPLQECIGNAGQYAAACGSGEATLLKDAIVRNAFLWPVTWLVVGTFLLFMRLEPTARVLTLSGVLYGIAYLIIGVASGFRYFYWTEFAIQVALVWQLATAGLPQWRRIVAAVAVTWAIGYAWRYGSWLF
jgi:hypothetical protein